MTCTEAGLRSCVTVITMFHPHLVIQRVQGTLFSHFKLDDISYHDIEHQIDIKSLSVSWKPIGLLRDTLIINNVILNGAHIKLAKTTQASRPFYFNAFRHIILNKLVINQFSIQADDVYAELNGVFTKQWNATWKAYIPHVDRFIPNASGSLLSSGKIVGVAGTSTLEALFQSKDLVFKNHALPPLQTEMRGQLTLNDKKLAADLKIKFAKEYTIAAQFQLPEFTLGWNANQPILGRIQFHSSRVAELITHIVPQIQHAQGTLQTHLEIVGSLAQPQMTGTIELKNGQASIPRLGLSLEKIHLQAHYLSKQPLTLSGVFHSGKGQASLAGTFDFRDATLPLSLTAQGKNLQIANLSEYKIIASPDLQLRFTNQRLHVQGKVDISQAEIKPKNRDNIITLPSEVIYVDKVKNDFTLPSEMTVQLRLHLDSDVHLHYKELQTQIGGNLQINKQPDAPATAIGELFAIKGTYHAYGQILTIQDGRVMFTGGPIHNPGLNIRAAKQINTVLRSESSQFDKNLDTTFKPIYAGKELLTIGIRINGTFDKPVISLFSDPTGLNQGDILSYLVFGHPQAQVSDNQNRMLLSAASALSSGGKNKLGNITHKIQDKLGLNELNVESTEIFNPTTGAVDSTTSVVIGKQLAPNLYAHYSIGLFSPISILNLRYKLSKRFAIQSETSSVDNGADLLYSIERD